MPAAWYPAAERSLCISIGSAGEVMEYGEGGGEWPGAGNVEIRGRVWGGGRIGGDVKI